MDITVLLKRVPDLVEDLEIDASGKALDPDAVSLKLNEFDDHALEEGLLLEESGGGSLTVIAVAGSGDGDKEVDKMLYTALAKGADKALKITGPRSGERAGTRALAELFAAVLRDHPADLVLTGVQAADDLDGQLAPTVAALLGRPCVEVVTGVSGSGPITVHKEYSGGVMAELEVDLPAVLGIQAARQSPRYAPVSKVRQIQQTVAIESIAAGASGASAGIEVVALVPPETGGGAQMLAGVDELVELLAAKGVI